MLQLLALVLNSNHNNPPPLPRQVVIIVQVVAVFPLGYLKIAPRILPIPGPLNHNLNHLQLEGQ